MHKIIHTLTNQNENKKCSGEILLLGRGDIFHKN
jgi:hypothetical protein